MMAMITDQERRALLGIARDALGAHLAGRRYLPTGVDGALGAPGAAFVTLRVDGTLRGCVGSLSATEALAPLVARLTVRAATLDPRFRPIVSAELDAVRVELSVLSEPFVITAQQLRVGEHGVIATRGRRVGLLLPQVAAEHGLGVEEFLAAACWKAGLARDAWRDPETRLEAFTALVFGDAS